MNIFFIVTSITVYYFKNLKKLAYKQINIYSKETCVYNEESSYDTIAK